MDPKPLSSFLEGYKKIPLSKKVLKNILEEYLGVPGVIQDVSENRGVLYIKASSVVKQEIFMKKKECIDFFNSKKLSITISDIR